MLSLLRCHVFEPVTCPVCKLIHHINPSTRTGLREWAECEASRH